MVLICIAKERVVCKSLVERFVKVEEADNVELERIYLIEKLVPVVSVVAV